MNKHFRSAGICFLALCISYAVTAQNRYTDLEVIGVSPSDTIRNGGSLPLVFKMTNHGPDDELPGDTTFYRLYQVEDGVVREIYTGMLSTGSARLVGKSSYYRDNYVIGFNLPDLKEPFTLDFCFEVFTMAFRSNGDTIGLSRLDTNSSNNLNCTKVTVIPRTSSISETETIEHVLNVYPNPADKVVLFRLDDDAYVGTLNVSISDLSGRVLLTRQFNAQEVKGDALSLNIAQLPIGVYMVQMQTKAASVSKRLIIMR